MKCKILILGLILALSGCINVIDQKGIKRAQDYCKDRDGLFSVDVGGAFSVMYVICKNGDKITVSQLEKKDGVME